MSNRSLTCPLGVAVAVYLIAASATDAEVFSELHHDTSGQSLRQIIAAPRLEAAAIPRDVDLGPKVPAFLSRVTLAPALEAAAAEDLSPLPEPAPSVGLQFSGYSQEHNRNTLGVAPAPPDINGDVGRDHYIQYVNLGFLVFDKASGTVAAEPIRGNVFWDGFGGPCEAENAGDPIVLYDHLADRWLFSQFTGSDTDGGGRQCVAVSVSDDPLGHYHRYEFVFEGVFNDYPKIGLWDDASGRRSGYYLTTNDFAGGFSHASLSVLERPQMLAGGFARMVRFTAPPTGNSVFFSVQPAHLEGFDLPPDGECASFVMAFDAQVWSSGQGGDGYQVWQLCVDWKNAPSSTLFGPSLLASKPFDSELCGFSPCIEQPGTNNRLDVSGQFTGYRATVRVLEGVSHMVVAHTVDVGQDQAGVRWAQLRLGSSAELAAEGVYSPDEENRWMGSAGLDAEGNIAIGYSVAGSSTHPGLRFTGRLPEDEDGKMRTETKCADGSGSATGVSRWGDYASMSIDPVDQCTFWFTGEVMAATSARDWTTQVCTFRFENCQPPDREPPDRETP